MTGAESALDLVQRRRLLVATLAATRLAATTGTGSGLVEGRRWLNRWSGVGLVAAGMTRQGFDRELPRFGDKGWRATFSPAGRAHSVVSGSAWEATPWRAVQRAAWEALG